MKKLSFFVLLLVISKTLLCQGVSYNEVFQVNTYTEGSQFKSEVAPLLNGGFAVTWQSHHDGDDRGVFAQVFDKNGVKVGGEILVNTYTNNMQWFPKLATLNSGNFVICWESWGQDSGSVGVYGQIFNEVGEKINNEFIINSHSANMQGNPAITSLLDGNFIVCWRSYLQDGVVSGIYAQLFDNNGIKLGSEFRVSSLASTYQDNPEVTALSNGGLVICWSTLATNEIDNEIYAQILNEDGSKIGNEFQVNTFEIGWQSNPDICSLDSGRFIICWDGRHENGINAICTQMYNNDGNKIGDETVIVIGASYPSISSLSNGNFIICWGGKAQILDQNSNRLFQEIELIPKTIFFHTFPSISFLRDGKFIITYDDSGLDGDQEGIFGKYFLNEPISHSLNSTDLIYPSNETTITRLNTLFQWSKSSQTPINFSWELTYDLYLDTEDSFSNATIIAGIEDTTFHVDSLLHSQTYFWKVLARNFSGDSVWSSSVNHFIVDTNALVGIAENELSLPNQFELSQNYPNPFNPVTKIKFQVPSIVKGEMSNVKLIVYDILGNELTTLVNEAKTTGTYEVEFDGSDLSSGIYFYQLVAGKYSTTRKMLLMK